MSATESTAIAPHGDIRRSRVWLLALLGMGTAVRVYLAWLTFLNPDEALHYFVSAQPSFGAAYKASLTMAHPPLMILLLHPWTLLGTSEFFLRLPFVIAGILFCWVMFLWVKQIAGQNAACFTLALCLFLPSLISLSAEIRQYSLLLLFCSASLYCLELGFANNSAAWIAASTAALYLALLTHYSALIFAAVAGVYGLLRIWEGNTRAAVKVAWLGGQIGALAIFAFLLSSQILPLHRAGMPSEIASSWLSTSIFQAGQDHFFAFASAKTVRLFRYFFSHGTIGILGLLLFFYGLAMLLRRGSTRANRTLAAFLVLPFFITLAAAIAGVYPYGGTRHDVLLVMFAIPAIAVGLDSLKLQNAEIRWRGAKILLLVVGLIICNAFSSPSGPTIRPRHQNRRLMSWAIDFLRSQTPHSTIVTDYQGGLVLSYYLCDRSSPLPFGQNSDQLFKWQCRDDVVLTSLRTQQGFSLPELPQIIDQASHSAPDTHSLWVFQTGWIEDKQQDWIAKLRQSGCIDMRNFGPNIRICRLVCQATEWQFSFVC
jgi:4-amino-4-deoxy-L-arabinose transferase-like glycosyltransferase